FERGIQRVEVEIVGGEVIARRFERGVLVDTSSRASSSPIKAKWDADRLCSEQLAEGFTQVVGDDLGATSQRELVEALLENPDELDTYPVYADWLTAHGDPWGQLIALQHALESLPRGTRAERRDELYRAETMWRFQHAARVWGALGETIVNEATQKYAC